MELRRADIIELVELVAREQVGALRIVAGDVELVLGMDSAAVSALSGTTDSPAQSRRVARTEVEHVQEVAGASSGAAAAPAEDGRHRKDDGQTGADRGSAVASGNTVTAPLVGIFYSAPEPGAPPYVEVGDHVDSDTTVGLIEAMKVFTAVQAGSAGLVHRVLVGNEEFVEFGQALMELDPQ